MSNAEIEAYSAAVEVLEELTQDEQRERHQLFATCGKSVRLKRE